MAPQIIYLSIVLLSIGYSGYKSGKSNSPRAFVSDIIAIVLQVILLWWGDFFDVLFK